MPREYASKQQPSLYELQSSGLACQGKWKGILLVAAGGRVARQSSLISLDATKEDPTGICQQAAITIQAPVLRPCVSEKVECRAFLPVDTAGG